MDAVINSKSPADLYGFIDSYVEIKLIKDHSYVGFVKSIDPVTGSVIIAVPIEESFQTVLLPGHAILNITPTENLKYALPTKPAVEEEHTKDKILERKSKILDWFKVNLIPMEDLNGVLKVGDVEIVPPYSNSDIYAKNLIVYSNIYKLLENMPQ